MLGWFKNILGVKSSVPTNPNATKQPSTSTNPTAFDLSDSNFKIQKQWGFTPKHIDSQLNIILQLLDNRMYLKKYLKNKKLLKDPEILDQNKKFPIMGGQDGEVFEYNGIYYGVWAEMYLIKKLKNIQDSEDSKTFLSTLIQLQKYVKNYSYFTNIYRLNPLYNSMNTSIEALIIVYQTPYVMNTIFKNNNILKKKIDARSSMLQLHLNDDIEYYGLPENDDEMEKQLNKIGELMSQNSMNNIEHTANSITSETENIEFVNTLKTVLEKVKKYKTTLILYEEYLKHRRRDSRLQRRNNELIKQVVNLKEKVDAFIETKSNQLSQVIKGYETLSTLENTDPQNESAITGGRRRRKTMNKQRKSKKGGKSMHKQRKTKKARK